MYNFKGIKPEIIDLLCLNSFNDSKSFYEEHKEELKQGATVPMRQIMLDLADMMTQIDEKMYTDPIYTVSRIRRDTRRTKNKMMYRENLWIMFRRNKKIYPNAPFFWFEFRPDSYNYGIGFFVQRPAQFDELRKLILKHPKKWLNAVEAAEKAGMSFGSYNVYKNDRVPDAPEKLKKYLNAKDMSFMYTGFDMGRISSPYLIDELKEAFSAAEPMYRFMIEAYENIIAEDLL